MEEDHTYTYMTSSHVVITTASSNASNSSPAADIFVPPPCRDLLYAEIGMSSVKIWDVMILVPNVLFLIYLLVKIRHALAKFRMTNSPMFTVCLILVCMANVISVLRCIISMVLSSDQDDIVDRVMWLVLKFFLLATELSVIVFGFMFGHLDSRRSIQRVIGVTFTVSFAYSLTQAALEFFSPNRTFHNITTDAGISYDLYGHGGMMFWFISSLFLSLLYIAVCILPLTGLHDRCAMPVRKSFYIYCFLLAVLNSLQSAGCAMLHFGHIPAGWCIVDVTAYLYFIGFAPLIYFTFLRNFFMSSLRPPVEISYRTQADDSSQDDVDRMWPHVASFYGPPFDVVINARTDDADRQEPRAAGAFPSMLTYYDVGIPDLKPSQAHHSARDSLVPEHPHESRYSDASPVLPQ